MSEKNPNDSMDHTWKMRMLTLMKRKKMIEVSETIDKAIWEWYFDRGLDVPNWKYEKDPQWWIDYLEELDKEK